MRVLGMNRWGHVWAALLALGFCAAEARAGHFVDMDGNPLQALDAHSPLLAKYFGDSVPQRIVVRREARADSRFDEAHNAIVLSDSLKGEAFVSTGIHEASHVAMSRMTRGASLHEESRFFDEGFAYIIEGMVANRLQPYKQRSLSAANREIRANRLSFALLQNWTRYNGDWKSSQDDFRRNPDAYAVGASFVFYVMDTYGEGNWLQFLRHMGQAKNLELALGRVTGKSMVATEREWKQYILGHDNVSITTPGIVKQFPENGADNVDPGLREIYVVFDQEMDTTKIFIINDGVDFGFRDAFWKDGKTLAISVKNGLTPSRSYRTMLGSKLQGLLQSAMGSALPETAWSFKTGSGQ